MGPRQVQAIANRMKQVVHVVWCIAAPPGVHTRRPHMGAVAKSRKAGAPQQCDPTRGEMFTDADLVVAAALDNDGRTTALDDAKGGGEAGWASAQNQDRLALLSPYH